MTRRAVGSTSTEPPTIAAMQLAFAICVALVVLNLYASQVLVRPITASYGIPDGATGLVTAAGLIGYPRPEPAHPIRHPGHINLTFSGRVALAGPTSRIRWRWAHF